MRIIAAAIIIGAAMLGAAFLIGGRYAVVGSQDRIVYVVDRFTGRVFFCAVHDCQESKFPMDFSSQATPAVPPQK